MIEVKVLRKGRTVTPGGIRKHVFVEGYDVMKARNIDMDAPMIAWLGIQGWELVHVTENGWMYLNGE